MRTSHGLAALPACAVAFGLASLGVCGFVAPAAAGGIPINPGGAFVVVDDDDCTLSMRVRSDGGTWKISADGCFEVNEAEDDIASLPAGGWFKAEERRWGRTRHSIEIRGERSGASLTRVYKRDGKEVPFDDEARDWMADALRIVFKHTDFGRDAHIERVLERDGVSGALAEVGNIDSDHQARKTYLRLAELRPDDPELLVRVPREAGGHFDSSYEMAELVVGLAEHRSATPRSLEAAAEAASTIDSSYERRRALASVVHASDGDAAVLAAVLASATDIDSDHERCELLHEIAKTWTIEPGLARKYFDSVSRMDSDYERARALRAVIDSGTLAPEIVQDLAATVSDLGSDYHKAEVLTEVARQPLDTAAREACVRAARTIDSNYHRGRVLDALHVAES